MPGAIECNSQASCWEVPLEVAELRKKKEEVSGKPRIESVPTGISTADKSPVSFTLNVPAAITGGREAMGHKAAANSALDLIKKKLQDSGAQMTVSPTTAIAPGAGNAVNGVAPVDASVGKGMVVDVVKDKASKGDNASSDESSESEEEDLEPTKEQKVHEFKVGFCFVSRENGTSTYRKWSAVELLASNFSLPGCAVLSYHMLQSDLVASGHCRCIKLCPGSVDNLLRGLLCS